MTPLYNHKHVLIVITRVALAVCHQGVCLKLCAVAEGSTSVSRWPRLNTEPLTPKTVGEVTPQRVFDASFSFERYRRCECKQGHTCAHKQTQMVFSLGKHMDFFQVLELNWLIPPISCLSDLTFPEVPDPRRKTLKAQRDRPLDCGNCTVDSYPIKLLPITERRTTRCKLDGSPAAHHCPVLYNQTQQTLRSVGTGDSIYLFFDPIPCTMKADIALYHILIKCWYLF